MSTPQLLAETIIDIGGKAVNEVPYATAEWNTKAGAYAAFGSLLSQVMDIVLVIATILLLLYLFWGALDWLNSSGDKGKTEKARDKMTQAVIGLFLVVSVVAILLFVQQLLGFCVLDFTGRNCQTPLEQIYQRDPLPERASG